MKNKDSLIIWEKNPTYSSFLSNSSVFPSWLGPVFNYIYIENVKFYLMRKRV